MIVYRLSRLIQSPLLLVLFLSPTHTVAATDLGDRLLEQYFLSETELLTDRAFEGIRTLKDWEARRDSYRSQLEEMLGLNPAPERTPLHAETVGTIEHGEADRQILVERMHFQPVPGLYVAGNLYIPKQREGPCPAILYVCGHANVVKDGVRMGNKTAYQHHGIWFARHGYVCLVIDTIQRGEFEGIHHGTYRHKMWWWNNRGYTPAGVEAWTGIRAIDYLQSRDEVDPDRIGITGRSGGGVYSWWVAALDERVKVAVPVAGITSLHNHVIDDCVEGHCDCMFMVNTYRWDFPLVAALIAPRPLLISNSDKDRIFPLDGVVDVHAKVRHVYRLYGAEDKLGLQITEGPHRDTQELRVHAFRWMNRFLKDDDSLIREPAEKAFDPKELKVFDQLPGDERVTTIQETFLPAVDAMEVPEDREELDLAIKSWRAQLKSKTFNGWPNAEDLDPPAAEMVAEYTTSGLRLSVHNFLSQPPYRLPFYLLEPTSEASRSKPVTVTILDQKEWLNVTAGLAAIWPQSFPGKEPNQQQADRIAREVRDSDRPLVLFPPRGIGPTAWSAEERSHTHIRRRFMLLGQTADAMRIWDVRRLLQSLASLERIGGRKLHLAGNGDAAAWALYASLFESNVSRLNVEELPMEHRDSITLLNVSRIVQLPQAALMAASQVERVLLTGSDTTLQPWRKLTDKPWFRVQDDRLIVRVPGDAPDR